MNPLLADFIVTSPAIFAAYFFVLGIAACGLAGSVRRLQRDQRAQRRREADFLRIGGRK